MQFKLQETDQGQFEIIQTLPVVVGVFPNQEMARKVFDFLVDDYMEAAPEAKDKAPLQAALVDEQPPAMEPAKTKPKLVEDVAAPPKLKRQPAKLKIPAAPKAAENSNVKPLAWTDDEIDAALIRIQAGERVKDVAASAGKSFGSLRGKWANFKRYNKIELAGALTKPEIDDADRDDCRLCGKSFRPTAESLDLCAGCSRDT